jgi:hypothetical protein
MERNVRGNWVLILESSSTGRVGLVSEEQRCYSTVSCTTMTGLQPFVRSANAATLLSTVGGVRDFRGRASCLRLVCHGTFLDEQK